jgi:uncharacterized protein GlcG (DUF336 family)
MDVIKRKTISNALAKKLVAVAESEASRLGISVVTTIVDDSGLIVCMSRMDHAPLMSSEISRNKAYTAASFRKPTHEWYDGIKDNPPLLHGITHTDRLVIFGGGYPIFNKGDMIGAIGVSGGKLDQDMACCIAALEIM